MKVTRSTLVSVYNTYLLDLLRLCKGSGSSGYPADLKAALRAGGHKAISVESTAYICHAVSSLGADGRRRQIVDKTPAGGEGSTWQDDAALSFEPLNGVPFSAMLGGDGSDGSDGDRRASLATYMFTLATLAVAYDEDSDELAATVINVLSRAQQQRQVGSSAASTDLLQMMDGIIEDDIVSLLEKVSSVTNAAGSNDAPVGGSGSGSKIMDIATEISQDIDLSSLDPNALDLSTLADPKSVLGGLVGKVGAKIQGKLSSGEINQAELMNEACGLLQSFQPLMASFASAATSGGGGGGGFDPAMLSSLASLMGGMGGAGAMMGGGGAGKQRDRLRKKLAARDGAAKASDAKGEDGL